MSWNIDKKRRIATFEVEDDAGEERTIEVRAVWEICDTCEGGGTTVFGWGRDDPAVHTQEDFDEDPDLREDLMSGALDKPCPECRGEGKVLVPEPGGLSEEDNRLVSESLQADAEYDAICAAERRMGA